MSTTLSAILCFFYAWDMNYNMLMSGPDVLSDGECGQQETVHVHVHVQQEGHGGQAGLDCSPLPPPPPQSQVSKLDCKIRTLFTSRNENNWFVRFALCEHTTQSDFEVKLVLGGPGSSNLESNLECLSILNAKFWILFYLVTSVRSDCIMIHGKYFQKNWTRSQYFPISAPRWVPLSFGESFFYGKKFLLPICVWVLTVFDGCKILEHQRIYLYNTGTLLLCMIYTFGQNERINLHFCWLFLDF